MTSARSLPFLLCLLSFLGGTSARAQEPSELVRLSLARYERLMEEAQRTPGAQAAWTRGQVTVSLEEGVALVELSASAQIKAKGPAELPLLPAEFVLEQVTLDGREASLRSRGGALVALVEAGDEPIAVVLRYRVPVREQGGARAALVALPPLPGADLRLITGDEAGPVDLWPATRLSFEEGALRAALPATSAFLLRFGGAANDAVIRRADYALSVGKSIDAADVELRLEVELRQSEGEVALVPAEAAALMEAQEGGRPLVTRVGDGWHRAVLRGAGSHSLRLRFRVPIDRSQGQPQATVRMGAASITRFSASVPGRQALSLVPEVPLATSYQGQGEAERTSVEAYLPAVDQIAVRWTEPQASEEREVRLNTESFQLVALAEGVMRSRVIVRYQVLRGQSRTLSLALPEDMVLFRVDGEGIENWRTFGAEPDGESPRQVQVSLGQDLPDGYTIELELETAVAREEGSPLAIPVVRPLGAFRETGVVALIDGDRVGFAPATAEAFTKVGEDALPVEIRQTLSDRVSQAFQHIGSPGQIRSAVAPAPAREIRFDARVHSLYHVKEGALVGSAAILVDLKSGRQDLVRLSLPEKVNVLSVTAPSLNRHEEVQDPSAEEGRKVHEIRLTRAVEGAIQVDVEFELLLGKDLGLVTLPDVRVLDAEVEEGELGITADAGIEVQASEIRDLRPVPVPELAAAIRLRSPRELLLAYRYARGPWGLDLRLERHRTVETLAAVIESASVDTIVLEDGHIVTRAFFQVRNDERQYLRLAMPAGHTVWTVAAGGEKVKAVSDDAGALAIPLSKGESVVVEVVYELGFEPFDFLARMELVAPQADLVVTDAQWRVRVPARYALHGLDTNLKELEAWAWRGPSHASASGNLPLDSNEDTRTLVLSRAVHAPGEEPLALRFTLLSTPSEGIGYGLTLLALVLLAPVVRRLTRRMGLGLTGGLLLGLGLASLTAKASLWELSVAEGLLVALVLLVVALATWLRSRRRGEDT